MLSCEKQIIMTKSQVTEMILQEVRKDIEQFMSEEDAITSSIEYENKVIEICRSLGRKLIAGGDQVHKKGRNAKKNF
jgi:hypothetical protein